MWDAIGSPYWVQHCLNRVNDGKKQPKGSLDCDEFAVWCAAVMYSVHEPRVLNVFWRDGKKTGGHNVCFYTFNGSFYHTGNWNKHGPFDSISDVISDVLAKKGLHDGDLIGWATFSPMGLKLHGYGTELPKETL